MCETTEKTVNHNVTQAFPLYFTLQKKLEGYRQSFPAPSALELTDTEKIMVVETCKHMDDVSLELVYAVIRFHHLHHDQGTLMELPYQIKKNKQNIYRLDLHDLPPILQRLVFLYIELHRQSASL